MLRWLRRATPGFCSLFEPSRSSVRIFLGLSLLACTPPDADSLRFGLSANPGTLDPRYATDAASARINRLVYRSLVDFDTRLKPVPALASWEQLTPRQYRFTLGVGDRRFHDGRRLTAWDVKATYDFILDADSASPHRSALSVTEQVKVNDADMLEFHLRRTDPLFPGRLVTGILPAHLMASGHPFETQPVGSGPFTVVGRLGDDGLTLKRLADGQLVEFLQVADPTVRVLKLLRGELDLLQGDLPHELIKWLSQRSDIRVRLGEGSSFTYIGFNLEDPAVGQLPMRRAIAHAIDRQAIIRYFMGSAARPANALLIPDHWAGNPALVGYDYNPARCRTLLAAAGYDPSHPLKTVYKTSSDPFRVRLATVIQRQLQEVGIEVEIRSYDWGTFYGDTKAGRFQIYTLSWVGLNTPDIFRYVFHSRSVPPAGASRGRYRSADADALIDPTESQTDEPGRAALCRELQRLLPLDLPYVPLWYEDVVAVARADISGCRLAADGNYDGLLTTQRNR